MKKVDKFNFRTFIKRQGEAYKVCITHISNKGLYADYVKNSYKSKRIYQMGLKLE